MQGKTQAEWEGSHQRFQLGRQIQAESSQVEEADEVEEGRGQTQGRGAEACLEELVQVASQSAQDVHWIIGLVSVKACCKETIYHEII